MQILPVNSHKSLAHTVVQLACVFHNQEHLVKISRWISSVRRDVHTMHECVNTAISPHPFIKLEMHFMEQFPSTLSGQNQSLITN